MNWAFVAAGCLALTGSAIHGVVGDRIVRRIDPGSLPGNQFRGLSTKFLIRVTWHFVTIAFMVLGVGLILAGIEPDMAAATGVAYVAGAAFFCWTILGLGAGMRHGGIRAFKSHPAPIVFLLTLMLISWGATRL